jgi:hypothetical protein
MVSSESSPVDFVLFSAWCVALFYISRKAQSIFSFNSNNLWLCRHRFVEYVRAAAENRSHIQQTWPKERRWMCKIAVEIRLANPRWCSGSMS